MQHSKSLLQALHLELAAVHADLRSQLTSAEEQHKSHATAARADIDKLTQRTQTLQQQRQAAHDELEQSLAQLEDLRQDISRLEAADRQQSKHCDELKEELLSERQAVKSLNTQIEAHSDVIAGELNNSRPCFLLH